MGHQGEIPVTNTIGFDVEHWYAATLVADAVENPADRIENSLSIVLDVLARNGVTATFFVVGELAAARPAVVRRIRDAGHELASHGHTHTPLFELSPDAFRAELERSAAAIREATGVEPDGFRAPNFSVTRRTDWAMEVLAESDYRYDSSVFPTWTPMYGVVDAPRRPYAVPAGDPFRVPADGDDTRDLVEVPLAVADHLVRFPVAGGFYGRLLPAAVLECAIGRLNARGRGANVYFHPWEFNEDVPFDDLAVHRRFVSFHGIERMAEKLDRLLGAFDWQPVGSVLDGEGGWNAPVLDHRRDTETADRLPRDGD